MPTMNISSLIAFSFPGFVTHGEMTLGISLVNGESCAACGVSEWPRSSVRRPTYRIILDLSVQTSQILRFLPDQLCYNSLFD
jgi:hypothetical protein